jgi:N-acetylmuramoyl-L-alanine amidase
VRRLGRDTRSAQRMEFPLSVWIRWAAGAVACLGMAVATSAALSQEGASAPIVDAATPQTPAPLLTHEPVVGVAPEQASAVGAPARTASLSDLVAARSSDIEDIDDQTDCMAKVVHHEAANQSLEGQLAVAEVIINRIKSGRFASTPCAVANQPGQFFHTASYRVPHSSPRWRTAVAIARVAQTGAAKSSASGALFFHASYAHLDWGRRRQLVTQIGGQIFYR